MIELVHIFDSPARARPAAWCVRHRALTILVSRGRSISRLAAADWAHPCFPAPSPDDAEVLDAADPTPCRP